MDFDTIPNDIRVPLAYIEFNNTRAQAGLPADSYTILVLGQRLATGTVLAGVPTEILGAAQAEQYFGRGSMLASMLAAMKKANAYTRVVAIALDDAEAGAASTGKLVFTGAATQNGTLNLMVAGTQVPVGVSAGDDAEAVAAATVAAINANTALPVTAAVNGVTAGQVDVTARHKGEAGNTLDLRLNYYTGQLTPAGLQVAITAMSGGTTNPDVSDAIAAMGDAWYQTIVMPYTDAANLTALETELADRFGGVRQIDGEAFTAFRGTAAATDTFGLGRNGLWVTCMGTSIAPHPPYLWAAVNAAVAAASLANDPAQPLQTLALPGILPPAQADQFTFAERNLQLHSGIATHKVDAGGNVLIERQVTMYQKNAYDIADTSYLDVEKIATLSYIRFASRSRITSKYPRHKLAGDTVKPAPSQKIVTPTILRAELIALAVELRDDKGLIEDIEQFKRDLVVEIDPSNPDRANASTSPNLINQLRIFAEQIQFID
ncbi:phage tail sheath subtilisin-like domain-containing protein [Frateuria sp. YIM B11624]|uniref:phage tail sheath subtilisin-like domain-containing protein n=1 Tax=Frateuria sp. YIM B11624 TaxID=3143185 RepID=UPI003C74E437